MSYEQMLKKKKCIVTIKNEDELWAARAIVTMKALADQDPQYENIKRGRGQQGYLAHKLHRDGGVPEGPCGLDQVKQIQQFMGPTYQIQVFEAMQGLLWYKDCVYDAAPKKIKGGKPFSRRDQYSCPPEQKLLLYSLRKGLQ